MSEQVGPLDLAVSWEPNAPEAVLISNDLGVTCLAVRAADEDPDRRCVVFVWHGTTSASMGAPNDETLAGHRLYGKGLRDVSAGIVHGSRLVTRLEQQNRLHPRHNASAFSDLAHHVIALKEGVVEVAARTLSIERHPGSPLTAAAAALHA